MYEDYHIDGGEEDLMRVFVVSNDFSLKNGIAAELGRNSSFSVVTTVLSISQAEGLLSRVTPNALLLDLAGISASPDILKKLIDKYKLLVIILGSHPGIPYISKGINNIVSKPIPGNIFSMRSFCEELSNRIMEFSRIGKPAPPPSSAFSGGMFSDQAVGPGQRLIVMTASTGGTEALPVVLQKMPANVPPILIVQHMPKMFTKQFAERLDKLSKFTVKEAENGDYLQKGLALLAPGDYHMRLIKKNQRLAVECFWGDKLHGVRPAADITFQSVLNICGGNVVGVILTGMGSDGARGLFELRAKGAKIIAQNQQTCVVYGMPKAAVDMGAADFVLPLDKIADKVAELM
jgi:two-component system chemotaxis response regulator CheB